MRLSLSTAEEIKELLAKTIREKLNSYKPETTHMPFHYRLIGRDRYAMFSFIQSLNTSFGMSIWEQVAVILAMGARNFAKRQYILLGEIDKETEKVINDIHYKLRKGEMSANKRLEIDKIRSTVKKGQPKKDPDSVVDLFVMIGDEENYFDITSAKPNMKEFAGLKT